jgi:hypothetical protein
VIGQDEIQYLPRYNSIPLKIGQTTPVQAGNYNLISIGEETNFQAANLSYSCPLLSHNSGIKHIKVSPYIQILTACYKAGSSCNQGRNSVNGGGSLKPSWLDFFSSIVSPHIPPGEFHRLSCWWNGNYTPNWTYSTQTLVTESWKSKHNKNHPMITMLTGDTIKWMTLFISKISDVQNVECRQLWLRNWSCFC